MRREDSNNLKKESYKEFTKYQNDSITNYKSNDDRIQKIRANFKLCEEKYKELLRKFYILKLFEKATDMSDSFFDDFKMIDKYLKTSKTYLDSVKKLKELTTIDMPSSSIVDCYYKVCDMIDILDQIKEELGVFESHYYPKFKMTSYNITKTKTKEELERLAKEVNSYIETYNTLEDAYDYVCYNSGEVILDAIEVLVNELKKHQDKLKIRVEKKYFLESDAIIFMDYIGWVNLFSKLQYVFERVDRSLYKDEKVDELLKELQNRYLVVLIFNEKRN